MELATNTAIVTFVVITILGAYTAIPHIGAHLVVWVSRNIQAYRRQQARYQRQADLASEWAASKEAAARLLRSDDELRAIVEELNATPYDGGSSKAAKASRNKRARLQRQLREKVACENIRAVMYNNPNKIQV